MPLTWPGPGSNRRPSAFQVDARPTSYLAGRHRSLREPKCLAVMVTLTGLEPATSAVTGRRANQLRHRAFCATPSYGAARTPYGIRTRATALKGRRPRPLDEGGQPNLSEVPSTALRWELR